MSVAQSSESASITKYPVIKPDANIIRKISAADTMHDFGKLADNIYYKTFFTDLRENTDFNIAEFLDTLTVSNVETKLMDEFHLGDKDPIEFLNFTEHNIETNKPFFISSDDINRKEFKTFLALITSSASPHKNVYFITDTTLLPQKTVCNMQIDVLQNGAKIKKQAAFINSQATEYDRGTNVGGDFYGDDTDECVIKKNIPARLKQKDGNLFGLSKIKVYSDDNNNGYFKYKYYYVDEKNDVLFEENEIKLTDFIFFQSDMPNRNLKFFQQILVSLLTKTPKNMMGGGGSKRKRENTAAAKSARDEPKAKKRKETLQVLFDLLFQVYKLDYTKFNFYNNNKINVDKAKPFIKILFDFKRAGDQLQAKAARNENIVFISNDRISLIYAKVLGVPSIKTGKIIKNNKEHSDRKFAFYNFDKDTVITDVLNRKDYFKELMESNLRQYERYIEFLVTFKNDLIDTFIQVAFSDNTSATDKIKIKNQRLSVFLENVQNKVLKSLTKSLRILNLGYDQVVRRSDRKLGQIDTTILMKHIYLYRYVHTFNVVLNIIVFNFLNEVKSLADAEASSGTRHSVSDIQTKFLLYQSSFDAKKDNLNSVKKMLQDLSNDSHFYMAQMFDISVYENAAYIKHIIKSYYQDSTIAPILYDDRYLSFTVNMLLDTDNNNAFFTEYQKAIKTTFIAGFERIENVKIAIVTDLIQFIETWHRIIPQKVSKIPNITFFNKELMEKNSTDIYVENDVLGKMKKYADEMDNILGGFQKALDNLYSNTQLTANIENLGQNGGLATIKDNKKSKHIVRPYKTLNALYPNHVGKTPFDEFVEHLEYEYNINDEIDDMIKLLVVFFVKQFKIFDKDGDITQLGINLILQQDIHYKSQQYTTIQHLSNIPSSNTQKSAKKPTDNIVLNTQKSAKNHTNNIVLNTQKSAKKHSSKSGKTSSSQLSQKSTISKNKKMMNSN